MPALLVFDEPTDGLDPIAVVELRGLLRRLQTEHNLTLVLSSHLLGEIEKLVDTIFMLNNGRRVFCGSPDKLLGEERQILIRIEGELKAGVNYLSQKQALYAFFLAWPAAAVALTPALAMSFMVSAWVKNPINAVAASVAIYLVLYVISEIHFFIELRPYLFTTYIGYWRGLFREQIIWPDLLQDGAKLLAFTFAFLSIAYHRFRIRQEI
jgi:hypothetical protein